jgi:hypothetical protein
MPSAREPPKPSRLEAACAPLLETLTRVVRPVLRSRTNASLWLFVSCGTRFVASELKTT